MKKVILSIMMLVAVSSQAEVFSKQYFKANNIQHTKANCLAKAQGIAKAMSSKEQVVTAAFWGINTDAITEVYQLSADINSTRAICIQLGNANEANACDLENLYQVSCDSLKAF